MATIEPTSGIASSDRVLVVGASLAGSKCVERLRELGHSGDILVVDCDPHAPYDRPQLSKQFLVEGAHLEGARWWPGDCDLIRARAELLDVKGRSVEISVGPDGRRRLTADAILVATGAVPRRLPVEPDGTIAIRSADDALRLRDAVDAGARHALVIGAGSLGTEISSSLRSRDVEVSIVDSAPVPLGRLLGKQMGTKAIKWMQEWGVNLHLGEAIGSIEKHHDGLFAELTSGIVVECDIVVSSVGAVPQVDWLRDSGLAIDDGVRCAESGAVLDIRGTPVPGIFAAGDVASVQQSDGSFLRQESWTSAMNLGANAADVMYGRARTINGREKPYFWTDQFGRKIQVYGRPTYDGELVCEKPLPKRNGGLFRLTEAGETKAWIGINAQAALAQVMTQEVAQDT